MSEAFFAASSSIVNRPTIRSSSAICCCSSPRLGSVAKISGARFRNSAFQREKTGALNWCSRQISATVLAPVSSSITRRALNSGLKFRRFAIRFPLSWTHCTLTIAPVQFLGVITLPVEIRPVLVKYYGSQESTGVINSSRLTLPVVVVQPSLVVAPDRRLRLGCWVTKWNDRQRHDLLW
jgi:hypothetical protein